MGISGFLPAPKQQFLLSDLPHAAGDPSLRDLLHEALEVALELVELLHLAQLLQLLAPEALRLFANDAAEEALGTLDLLEPVAGKHAGELGHFLSCSSNALLILPLIYPEYNV